MGKAVVAVGMNCSSVHGADPSARRLVTLQQFSPSPTRQMVTQGYWQAATEARKCCAGERILVQG